MSVLRSFLSLHAHRSVLPIFLCLLNRPVLILWLLIVRSHYVFAVPHDFYISCSFLLLSYFLKISIAYPITTCRSVICRSPVTGLRLIDHVAPNNLNNSDRHPQ